MNNNKASGNRKVFYQDAKSGKIVKEEYAEKHQKTTIKHSFTVKKKK